MEQQSQVIKNRPGTICVVNVMSIHRLNSCWEKGSCWWEVKEIRSSKTFALPLRLSNRTCNPPSFFRNNTLAKWKGWRISPWRSPAWSSAPGPRWCGPPETRRGKSHSPEKQEAHHQSEGRTNRWRKQLFFQGVFITSHPRLVLIVGFFVHRRKQHC